MADDRSSVLFFGFVAHPNGAAVAVKAQGRGGGAFTDQPPLLTQETLLTAQEATNTP